ncbi:MAG: AAA family ATPase [Methylobacter sp.]|nr:AAA family ATPase [Methylobacter sp.]
MSKSLSLNKPVKDGIISESEIKVIAANHGKKYSKTNWLYGKHSKECEPDLIALIASRTAANSEPLIVPDAVAVEAVEADTVDVIAVSGAILANDVVESVAVVADNNLELVAAGLASVVDIKSALSTAKLNKKHPPVKHAEAERFLNLLDEGEEQFTFQTFDDDQVRKDPSLTKILIGTYEQHAPQLTELNMRGAGIFVTVNRTSGNGRTIADMLEPRVIFNEDDCGNSPSPAGLEPHIVVVSSPGKKHDYYLIDGATAADWPTWDGCQLAMALDFGSDKNAVDRTRVLRLPGYFHMKDPKKPHQVYIRSTSGEQPYSMAKIIECVPPKPQKATQRPTAPGNSEHLPDLESALEFIDPDCGYKDWMSMGMALHHESDGGSSGFDLWNKWSSGDLSADHQAVTYPAKNPDLLICKWNSFNSSGNKTGTITRKTIFKMAQDNDWLNPKKKQSSSSAEPPPRHEKPGVEQPSDELENKQKRDIFKLVSIADVFTNPPIKQQSIWGEYIAPKNLTLIAAHGGTGKTTLANQLGVHVAIGRDFLGLPVKQSKTLIFSAEDATDQVRISIAKICKADGIDPVEVARNLIILDATDAPILYEEAMQDGIRKAVPTYYYYELERFIKREKIEFLIVDNASDTFGANPIDRMAVTSYILALVRLVRDAGGAVLLVSHVNKNTSTAGKKQTNTESYADSAAWHNAARSRLFLNATDDNGGLVLSHQKNNLGPKQPDLYLRFRADGGGMEVIDASHVAQVGAKKAEYRANSRASLLKLIYRFYEIGESISPSSNSSTTNAYAKLKAQDSFPFKSGIPKEDKAECFECLRECQQDKLLEIEVYKTTSRHESNRWALTPKGVEFINEKAMAHDLVVIDDAA